MVCFLPPQLPDRQQADDLELMRSYPKDWVWVSETVMILGNGDVCIV